LTLCFNDTSATSVNDFLTGGGATNIVENTPGALAAPVTGNGMQEPTGTGTLFQFTGMVTVNNGDSFSAAHDDGASLQIGTPAPSNPPVINAPGPTSSETTMGAYTGPSGTVTFDLVYGECCGLPGALGISLPLASQIVSLPGTPNSQNLGQLLFNLDETGPSDANTMSEGGQTKSACNNGPSTGGPITGAIPGNVTLLVNQQCTYQQCEFLGNLTINGGSAFITNCQVDGNVTVIAGSLSLADSGVSGGNTNISQASMFNVGPQSQINGNLTIQNLGPNPLGTGAYTVCSTTIKGNLTVQNNQAAIQIGTGQANCQGNKIGGSLACFSNANVTSGGNTVGGHFQGQCSG
jgi:hypothetical protein